MNGQPTRAVAETSALNEPTGLNELTDTWRQLALAARRGNAESEQLLAPFMVQLAQDHRLISQYGHALAGLLNHEEQDLLIWLLNPTLAPPQWQGLLTQIRLSYQQDLIAQQ